MLTKPKRLGIIFGEVWTCRTGTTSRLVNIRSEDENGDPSYKRFRVEQAVESTLRWDGADWVTEAEFRVRCHAKASATARKTIRRT